MHGQQNITICDAKQAKQTHQYKNIKTKLYKNNAAIWYNKTCRIKQLIKQLYIKLVIYKSCASKSSRTCVFDLSISAGLCCRIWVSKRSVWFSPLS